MNKPEFKKIPKKIERKFLRICLYSAILIVVSLISFIIIVSTLPPKDFKKYFPRYGWLLIVFFSSLVFLFWAQIVLRYILFYNDIFTEERENKKTIYLIKILSVYSFPYIVVLFHKKLIREYNFAKEANKNLFWFNELQIDIIKKIKKKHKKWVGDAANK